MKTGFTDKMYPQRRTRNPPKYLRKLPKVFTFK